MQQRGNVKDTAGERLGIAKAPTGISGLDDLLDGGLPAGRPTLVTGGAGSGKTMFAVAFLVAGALSFDEPGVLFAFEETVAELTDNLKSLGIDLQKLQQDRHLFVESVRLGDEAVIETGSYGMEGLFIRLGYAIESVGAKRVVLDTIEALFGLFDDERTVRRELVRLFRWLKDRGVTAVITGERGGGLLNRHGLEEYVSDCVILLDNRVHEGIATRNLRVVKYRGSQHGINEYPFLISDRGLGVLPLTSLGLVHEVIDERVSTGVSDLDEMLGGGIYRGSTVLITGEAGTGKTTLSTAMIDSACRRGERALFVSFEESPAQLMRNMRSVGYDMQQWVDSGLLVFLTERSKSFGLEMHVAGLMRLVEEFAPTTVAIDAMTSLAHAGIVADVTSAVTREIDYLKARGITGVLTSLGQGSETSDAAVSSLVDTWLILRNVEEGGERNRLMFVRKSRGTEHSNLLREFVLSRGGPTLVPVYPGPNGVLTGSARVAQQSQDKITERRSRLEMDRRRRAFDERSIEVEHQIAVLRRSLEMEQAQLEIENDEELQSALDLTEARTLIGRQNWPASVDPGIAG